ncbi:MAG: CopG family transcriptional regulator [Gammaproteobacteria bacterium]|jgi:hypothetical protein
MTTKNPRVNVTLDQNIVNVLASLAKKRHRSISHLIGNIIMETLERHEDKYFSALAEELDVEGVKPISHDKAWK